MVEIILTALLRGRYCLDNLPRTIYRVQMKYDEVLQRLPLKKISPIKATHEPNSHPLQARTKPKILIRLEE